MDSIISIDSWSHAPRATVDAAGNDQLLPAQLDLSGHFGPCGLAAQAPPRSRDETW